jgi:hypothetical protein
MHETHMISVNDRHYYYYVVITERSFQILLELVPQLQSSIHQTIVIVILLVIVYC